MNEKIIKLESQGRKIIKFNLGDPDQPTPIQIIKAAFRAMKQGKTKYSSSAGEAKLREEIAKIHDVPDENVVITPGSKWAIFSSMYLLLKRGDNIIIPTPHWTAYELIARNLGVELRFLRTENDSNWRIDINKLQSLADSRTKLLVLNNPNNPTSKIIDENLLADIVHFANERKLTILSDEVYSDISFIKASSILDFDCQHILIKSFSKTFAMTGWRIGYAISERELAGRMIKLNQFTLTNVPTFIQYSAAKALELREDIAGRMRDEYRQRAKIACSILSKTKMSFSEPDAPFYLFPGYDGLDSERLALNLLDEGVAIAPGSAFGDYGEHFRIALTVPEDEIKLGLNKICEALK